jgi:hypothetical protein
MQGLLSKTGFVIVNRFRTFQNILVPPLVILKSTTPALGYNFDRFYSSDVVVLISGLLFWNMLIVL